MPLDEILFDAEEKMESAVTILNDEYRTIRTGRATPALVEGIRIDAYGTTTPLKQLGSIGVPDARQIIIRPFDRNILADIEKGLLKSDLGLTPQNDGKIIRLIVPPLSEERRRQLAVRLKEMAEESRVSIRNARRDANKRIEQVHKSGDLPEDASYKGKDEVQELTKKYEGAVDEVLKTKTAEIMEV